jgi:hypothetical protein
LQRLRRDLVTAVTAALALAASPGRATAATDTTVRLEYRADEQGGCVGENELRRMVTDQLGHDPFGPDAERRVAISIVRTEAGFQGRIVWTESDGRPVGQRLLASRSHDCREIAANVAFAVALQLQLVDRGESDSGAVMPGTEPPAGNTGEQGDRAPAPPPRPTPSVEPPAVPGDTLLIRPRLAVGAGPAVGLNLAPEATAFGLLFVTARFRRWSGELAADAALPVTQREPDGTGVVVNAMGAGAAGCAHVSAASACLLGRLGWLRARGTGVDAPSTSWGHFSEVGLRLAGSQELGRVTITVHADGLVMLSRWNVVLNDAVVWSVPRVAGLVGFDVALRFF